MAWLILARVNSLMNAISLVSAAKALYRRTGNPNHREGPLLGFTQTAKG